MLIGLTGGIGCGKSSAAAAFGVNGFKVIDVDQIVREEVLLDKEVIAMAIGRWGGGIFEREGVLDRGKLGTLVFGSPTERLWWESVVHPRVGLRWRARVAADPGAEWVVEVPLLFEARLEKGFDFIVCVGANLSTQQARVTARGMTQAQAEQRIASQLPLAIKLNSAHAVLWNEGSPEFLAAQVSCLSRLLRAADKQHNG
jgi:dephospho-CoA kinase